MLNLPPQIMNWIDPFAPYFYGVTTWMKAQVLLVDTLLTLGKRVVTEALRVRPYKSRFVDRFSCSNSSINPIQPTYQSVGSTIPPDFCVNTRL
jgi:hypothetical protein